MEPVDNAENASEHGAKKQDDHREESPKQKWSTRRDMALTLFAYALSIAALGFTVFVAFMVADIEQDLGERQIDASYVQLAVEVLRDCPTPESESADEPSHLSTADRALRGWAVKILSATSPVRLTDETSGSDLAEDLKSCTTRLPTMPSQIINLPGIIFEDSSVLDATLRRQLLSGPLPEGCRVVAHPAPLALEIPVFLGPDNVLSPQIATIPPGEYQASEFRPNTPIFGTGWFELVSPAGWISERNATPTTDCFSGTGP